MVLIGALSNRRDKLLRLAELRAQLLSQAGHSGRVVAQPRPRSGAIKDAILYVVNAADGPVSVSEVHAAVERHLSMRVSRDSVNSFLSTSARGEQARFERVGRGRYRLQNA